MSLTNTSNNFDFLRLVAAYFVLVSHQFALAARPEPGIGSQSLGALGVMIFFSISGYLVTQSWGRDPCVWRFLAKRILRIWPGLIAVTAATTLLLGPMVSKIALGEYLRDSRTWAYFQTLLLTIRHDLPGVFIANPYPNAVNGSLWTLPVEFLCYLALALIGSVGLLCPRPSPFIVVATLPIFSLAIHNAQPDVAPNFAIQFSAFFYYGLILHYAGTLHKLHRHLLLLLLGTTSVILATIGQVYASLLLVLPMLVTSVGAASTPFIRRTTRIGDLSYGIYIYAFPVQQTVIQLTKCRFPLWAILPASTLITVLLALLSWHLIEQPALRLKRHLLNSYAPWPNVGTNTIGPSSKRHD